MKNNLMETLMGAIVLAIAGIFLVFAYKKSGLKNDFNTHYTAKFDRVDGLQAGSEVRISGVKVGTIHEINLDSTTYMAHVDIIVKDDIKLPTDSSVEIVSDGLLNGKYMAIVPGGDEECLEPGQAITYTQSSVSLEAMIGQVIFGNKKDKDHNDKKTSIKADTALETTTETPAP